MVTSIKTADSQSKTLQMPLESAENVKSVSTWTSISTVLRSHKTVLELTHQEIVHSVKKINISTKRENANKTQTFRTALNLVSSIKTADSFNKILLEPSNSVKNAKQDSTQTFISIALRFHKTAVRPIHQEIVHNARLAFSSQLKVYAKKSKLSTVLMSDTLIKMAFGQLQTHLALKKSANNVVKAGIWTYLLNANSFLITVLKQMLMERVFSVNQVLS